MRSTVFIRGANIVKLTEVHVSLIAMRLLAKRDGSFEMRHINTKVQQRLKIQALFNFSITYRKALWKGVVRCDRRILLWTQRQISWMCLDPGIAVN
jgi:hypothetical protein